MLHDTEMKIPSLPPALGCRTVGRTADTEHFQRALPSTTAPDMCHVSPGLDMGQNNVSVFLVALIQLLPL